MDKQTETIRPVGLTALSIDELGERAAAIAQDIRFTMTRAMTDIVSLGEILLIVKERSEFGRYGNYGKFLAENGLEERTAQYSVAAYKRYAQKPEILSALGSVSKLKELLALPEALEDDFMAAHNVETMSARELRQEIRAAKQGTGAEKTEEKAETESGHEAQIRALEQELSEMKAQMRASDEEKKQARALADSEQERLSQAEAKQNQLRELLAKLREERGALEEENMRLKQAAIHRAERSGEEEGGRIDGATFGKNVRRFLSDNAEVSMMPSAYDEMNRDERSAFLQGLDTLEAFVRGARTALCGAGEATVK